MDKLTIALFVVLCGGAVFVVWGLLYIGQRLKEIKNADNRGESLNLMQQQIDKLRDQLGSSLDRLKSAVTSELSQVTGQVGKRLDSATNIIGGVQNQLGELKQANIRILEVGKDISSLQEILRPPKMRGGMGESLLKNILSQILPKKEFYNFEYTFKSGEGVL